MGENVCLPVSLPGLQLLCPRNAPSKAMWVPFWQTH